MLTIRTLGCQDYVDIWQRMQHFTAQRDAQTHDELWLCQHPPVFTQGQAGQAEHLGQLGDIPLVQTDRGGQVTYHGPGQLVFYPLLDLSRKGLGVKALVSLLEQIGQDLLALHTINASVQAGMPGLYVSGQKIASLGLKIKRGCSYHGMAINIDMDLSPFTRITPCGLTGMQVTQWRAHQTPINWRQLTEDLVRLFSHHLNYKTLTYAPQEHSWHCPTSP